LRQKSGENKNVAEGASRMDITVVIQQGQEKVSLESDESYLFRIVKSDTSLVKVTVEAPCFQGARHAVETLFQLMDWDMDQGTFLVVDDVQVTDRPFYPHRGLALDTARNFISVGKIEEVLDSLSYSKMNVLHWRLSGAQSFPVQMDFNPDFTNYGAYRADMVYSKEDVKDIVNYASDRGIVVIPELDAPGNLGAGWQAVDPDFTLCVERDPWDHWCTVPPCGQLNPVVDGMYDVLENIYSELAEMFGSDYFHMGGNEVNFVCWDSSQQIQTWLSDHGLGVEEWDFVKLWHYFLDEAHTRLDKASNSTPHVYLWNSKLTEPRYLDQLDSRFAVQLWSNAWESSDSINSQTIKAVAEGGYKMVFSNYDSTYLDCGFGSRQGFEGYWCNSFKGWKTVYENNPRRILEINGVSNLEEAVANILGGETTMMTEMTDEGSLMTKLEPRTAAYAETLWRDGRDMHWAADAEKRMIRHRERLRERGIAADGLTQRWCMQNPGEKC